MAPLTFDITTVQQRVSQLCRKKEKNTEHTHIYTIFHNFSCPIFTSVVVYSRTTKNLIEKHKNNKDFVCFRALFIVLQIVRDYLFKKQLAQLCNRKKKNAEHTRMHTNFRNSSRQYSRRLLSILAQQTKKKKINIRT